MIQLKWQADMWSHTREGERGGGRDERPAALRCDVALEYGVDQGHHRAVPQVHASTSRAWHILGVCVMRCHITQRMKVQNALDDVAGTIDCTYPPYNDPSLEANLPPTTVKFAAK
jgi:hypothetical protein